MFSQPYWPVKLYKSYDARQTTFNKLTTSWESVLPQDSKRVYIIFRIATVAGTFADFNPIRPPLNLSDFGAFRIFANVASPTPTGIPNLLEISYPLHGPLAEFEWFAAGSYVSLSIVEMVGVGSVVSTSCVKRKRIHAKRFSLQIGEALKG